jgi:hypothetical protein
LKIRYFLNLNFVSAKAFSSEVDTGTREENASNQKARAHLRFNQKLTRSSRFHFAGNVLL